MKSQDRGGDEELLKALEDVDSRCLFGPLFFLRQLRGFVRDRCPDPVEGLPIVELHLADGEIIDLCHVIVVGPKWVVLAINDAEKVSNPPLMRTDLVPYGMISRVTVRSSRRDEPHIGFEAGHEPNLMPAAVGAAMSPEAALRALSGTAPTEWRKPK